MPLRLIRPYISTLIIQGGAMLSMMLVNVIVAKRWGIEGSTIWAQTKAIGDIGSALLMFGFPQALAYYISKYPDSLENLKRGSQIHGGCTFLISIVIAGVLWLFAINISGIPYGYSYFAIGASTGALIWSGLMRGISIAVSSKISSSIVTASYSYLVFLFIIISPTSKPIFIIACITIASILSAVLSSIIIKNNSYQSKNSTPKKYFDLLGFGFANLIISLFTALMPIYTFSWLSTNNKPDSIGEFSVVIFIIAVITTPINIISPYWYSKWSHLNSEKLKKELNGWFVILSIYGLILYFFFSNLTKQIIQISFGENFISTERSVYWIGLASIIFLWSRLLSAFEMSKNKTIHLSIASAIRLITIIIVTISIKKSQYELIEISTIAWILGELIFILTILIINATENKKRENDFF